MNSQIQQKLKKIKPLQFRLLIIVRTRKALFLYASVGVLMKHACLLG